MKVNICEVVVHCHANIFYETNEQKSKKQISDGQEYNNSLSLSSLFFSSPPPL
jgi:hypothetical protein